MEVTTVTIKQYRLCDDVFQHIIGFLKPKPMRLMDIPDKLFWRLEEENRLAGYYWARHMDYLERLERGTVVLGERPDAIIAEYDTTQRRYCCEPREGGIQPINGMFARRTKKIMFDLLQLYGREQLLFEMSPIAQKMRRKSDRKVYTISNIYQGDVNVETNYNHVQFLKMNGVGDEKRHLKNIELLASDKIEQRKRIARMVELRKIHQQKTEKEEKEKKQKEKEKADARKRKVKCARCEKLYSGTYIRRHKCMP